MTQEGEQKDLLIQSILMLSLMVVAIITATILKIKKITFISETSLYLIMGILVGLIFVKLTAVINFTDVNNKDIQLRSSFFYMVLLPPIIFEGGFTLQRITFVKNLAFILALALLGAMYSTIVTSVLMYSFTRFLYPSMTVLDTLVFGSIISSTDPISVLGMLPPSVDRNLYMIIFGESALNDAVALILYRFFSTLAEEQSNLDAKLFFQSLSGSILLFFGSVFIGVTIALLFSLLTKHLKSPEAPIFEQLTFLVFAYSSYLIADIFGFTGIISIFSCGVTMSHYAFGNMSKVTLLSSKVVLRTFSSMCDAFVFLYLGLGIFAFGKSKTSYHPLIIIAAVLSILISRTHVFIIGFFHNLVWRSTRPDKIIPSNFLVFLWFCGLRGAVSFALAVDTLDKTGIADDTKAVIFGTVITVVTITVIFMGGFTPLMMKLLKLDGPSAVMLGSEIQLNKLESNGENNSSTGNELNVHNSSSITTLDEYMPTDNANGDASELVETLKGGFLRRLYGWDKRFIKPIFSTAPRIKRHIDNVPNVNFGKRDHVTNADLNLFLDDDEDDDFLGDIKPKGRKIDDDDIDAVTIAEAAEMIGIRGSTSLINSSSHHINESPGTQRRKSSILGKKQVKVGGQQQGQSGSDSENQEGGGGPRGSPILLQHLKEASQELSDDEITPLSEHEAEDSNLIVSKSSNIDK